MTKSNIGITLDGVCTWQLVQDDAVVQQGTQHNLLLDSGLDNIGTYGLVDPYEYACVGTGTSDPVVSQTALDAEVARTLTRPSGYSDNPQYQSPGIYILEIVREFSEASIANQNLTEWGFSPVATGGVGVRERFRDDQGNPVTLTPDGSQKLRLTYEVTVTLTPTSPTPCSFTVTGVGQATSAGVDAVEGNYTLRRTSDTYDTDIGLLERILRFGNPFLHILNESGTSLGYADDVERDYTPSARFAAEPYVVGSFERRTGEVTVGATEYTGAIRYLGVGSSNGFAFREIGHVTELDTTHIITKDDLHTLSIDGPLISWSRA